MEVLVRRLGGSSCYWGRGSLRFLPPGRWRNRLGLAVMKMSSGVTQVREALSAEQSIASVGTGVVREKTAFSRLLQKFVLEVEMCSILHMVWDGEVHSGREGPLLPPLCPALHSLPVLGHGLWSGDSETSMHAWPPPATENSSPGSGSWGGVLWHPHCRRGWNSFSVAWNGEMGVEAWVLGRAPEGRCGRERGRRGERGGWSRAILGKDLGASPGQPHGDLSTEASTHQRRKPHRPNPLDPPSLRAVCLQNGHVMWCLEKVATGCLLPPRTEAETPVAQLEKHQPPGPVPAPRGTRECSLWGQLWESMGAASPLSISPSAPTRNLGGCDNMEVSRGRSKSQWKRKLKPTRKIHKNRLI